VVLVHGLMDKVFLAMDIVAIAATTDVARVTISAALHVPLVIIVPMEIVHPFVRLERTRQEVLQAAHHVVLALTIRLLPARLHQLV